MTKAFLFSLAMILTACSGSSSNPAPGGGNTGFNVPQDSDLVGHWVQGCANRNTYGSQSTQDYANGVNTVQSETFSSTSCATGSLVSTMTARAGYTIAGAATLANAFNVDFKIIEIRLAPSTQAIADVFNGSNVCGFNDWSAGVSKEVTGRNCGNSTMPAVGEAIFSIGKLSNNQLFVGQGSTDHDGKTPDTRHDTLDTVPLTKQ